VRVTTAFKRLLRLPGASVLDVSFTGEGVIVSVRLRRRRRVCSGCGQTGRHLQIHDRRIKRWRQLDLGAGRCVIECELRLLRCRSCGVRLEPVPWARPGRPPHARLRRRRRLAGPAAGQDADHRVAARRLGHGRADRRQA
jgi:transposase